MRKYTKHDSHVNSTRIFLSLLFLVCLLWTSSCAIYDINAFVTPEGLEEAAEAETITITTEQTQPQSQDDPIADSPIILPDPSGFTVYPTSAQSVILAWDPPASVITGYRVYYSKHDLRVWIPLDDVLPSAHPEYIVDYSGLGNGDFDFAVKSLNGSVESEFHTSLDGTAAPTQGWYLRWQITE